MAVRQFERGETVTFTTGEVAKVAKVTGAGIPFSSVLVWLDFPERPYHLVPYKIADLRKRIV